MQYSILALLIGAGLPAVLADGPPQSIPNWSQNGMPLDTGVYGGLNSLASTGQSTTRWPWGTVPKWCYDQAVNNGYCNPYDIEVYDVKYTDCSVAQTFCRCNNAQQDIGGAITAVGRMPVRARTWNRYYAIWPGNSCSAFSTTIDQAFFGVCSGSTGVYTHELSHNLDRFIAGGGNFYSGTDEWKNIISTQDTCVTDYYAHSSWTEAYAQVGVMALWNAKIHSIWDYPLSPACLANQLNKVISQLNPVFSATGVTCNRVWAKDAAVCMGPAARDSGNCAGIAAAKINSAESSAGNVTVEALPVLSAKEKARLDEKVSAARLAAEQKAGVHGSAARRFKA
ncbi:conidiation-specific protein (con-13) [Podospora didyma]|uniref:Conidiation-specific protein (Con-13) n=1 Tax=Podospora didyma TaxID=330526 RepID=A0AAE0KDZ0_9PEZI|nr:conidiation-specific protein (con-13) [Podospora didyma]